MANIDTLRDLVSIDSPTGFTKEAAAYIFSYLEELGYAPEYTRKGAVRCALGPNPTLALAAHTDTLGAIVSKINTKGTLRVSQLGGWPWNSFEGEYVRIHTLSGKTHTGTLLFDDPSTHANNKIGNTERKPENMHIRIDEDVNSEQDVKDLGISVGDIVCFDPRYQELKSGYIKSRFMDNKAGCFVLFEVARKLKEANKQFPVELFFSTYEEVGHGGTVGYSAGIEELLVIDMGVVGEAVQGRETHCSICAKDSSGPYDYDFRKRLTELAEENKIPYLIDIYPHYGSDGSAAWRAGNDYKVALIGPGVAASHGVERTHVKGIDATINLCLTYIDDRNK